MPSARGARRCVWAADVAPTLQASIQPRWPVRDQSIFAELCPPTLGVVRNHVHRLAMFEGENGLAGALFALRLNERRAGFQLPNSAPPPSYQVPVCTPIWGWIADAFCLREKSAAIGTKKAGEFRPSIREN